MSKPYTREGGWANRAAYPLILDSESKRLVQKYMLDKNLSFGKAVNNIIREGLISFGYLSRPKTPEQLRQEAGNRELQWVKDHKAEMSDKASAYWKERYPEAFS